MYKKYEVTASTQLSSFKEDSEEIQNRLEQLQNCVLMIQQHIGITNISGTIHSNSEDVTFVIRAACNGQNVIEMGSGFKDLMDSLKQFEPKKIIQKSNLTFWNDIHLVLNCKNIQDIVETLNTMQDKRIQQVENNNAFIKV